MRRRLSFRARILLLVLGVGLLPLVLVGWWITGTAARSGEELLRARLENAIDLAAADFGPRWVGLRASLLDLADAQDVRAELERGNRGVPGASDRGALASIPPEAAQEDDSRGAGQAPPEGARPRIDALPPQVASVRLLDTLGREVWSVERDLPPVTRLAPGTFATRLPIHDPGGGGVLGTIAARVHADVLLPARPLPSSGSGIMVGALERESGTSLIPIPLAASNLRAARFTLVDDEWLTERRALTEPAIDFIAAAPITPFVEPFQSAARRGLWILLAAAAGGLALAALLTARMTSTLSGLVSGAEAVTRGDLRWRVAESADHELGRVADAFNTMAESLDHTLAELAQRESLAAVGEFASELAHEVRNPLTAIRVNLQVVEESLERGSRTHDAQRAAIDDVNRLERTVSGALQLARSGRVRANAIDLRAPLEAALGAASPILERHGARLAVRTPERPIPVRGDSDALQQMLLNLVVNAAQASDPGGLVEVSAEARNGSALLAIRDDGRGMPPEVLARVREPFYSTRSDGTGLGLGIADRIARAHGAELAIASEEGAGTTVEIRLPLDGGA